MAGQPFLLQALDDSGVPVAGAKLYSYAAGTTTPKALYEDEAGTTPLSNPLVANASGLAIGWFKSGIGDYKFSLKDAAGVTNLIREIDNFTPNVDSPLYLIGRDAETALAGAQDAQAAAEAAQTAAELAQAAAETAETNAETAETNAASSASAASTSASNAATSASAASTSASTASTQASNAATSASAASTSATNAATSATNAATSATNAATSETNAGTSEDNALGSELAAAISEAECRSRFLSTSYANAAAAAADPDAEVGTLYNNTTDGEVHRITAITPTPASETIAGITSSEQLILDALAAGTAPSGTIASQANAEAGTNNTKIITPLRLWQGASRAVLGSKTRSAEYFGIQHGVEDMTKWEDAIAALNGGSINCLLIGAGVFPLDDATYLSALIGSNSDNTEGDFISIIGSGPATRIQVAAGAGTVGKVFDLGDGSTDYLLNCVIRDLDIEFKNTPSASDFVFEMNPAQTATISGISGRGWGAALKALTAGKITLRDWKIVPGAVAGDCAANFYFENASTIMMDDILYSSTSVDGNDSAAGKFVHLKPSATGSIDTFFMRMCHMQLFSTSSDGRPYGLYMEKASGVSDSLTNVFVESSVFDHTTIAGIYSTAGATNTANSRAWRFRDCRITTDTGAGISLNETAGASGIQASVEIKDNFIVVQDNSRGILVSGDNFLHVSVTGNSVLDRNSGTAKDYAIEMACSNFLVSDNSIGFDGAVGTSTGFTTAIYLSDTDSDNFTIGVNQVPPTVKYLSAPVFTTPPGSKNIHYPIKSVEDKRKVFLDHFEDSAISSSWNTSTSGAGSPSVAISTGFEDGYVQITTGTAASGGGQIVGAKGYLVPQGHGLIFRGQVRSSQSTSVAFFLGLTDQNSTFEMPFTLSGTTYTSNATDAVGILYDTDATTDTWRLVGVKNNVDATHQDTGIAGDTAFNEWVITLSPAGIARFYLGGKQVGTDMSAAVTTGTAASAPRLYPVLVAVSRSGSSRNVVTDYLGVDLLFN